METISNAFLYYFICVCLAGGHAYTVVAEFLRSDEKNGDVTLTLIMIAVIILTAIMTLIYYSDKTSEEKRAMLNLPLAFSWGLMVTVVINHFIANVDNPDKQKAVFAFLAIVGAGLLFMLFDALKARKKRAGFAFLGIHFGVSWVLLITALSKLEYPLPDLDFLGDIKKAVIFVGLGILTTVICGEFIMAKYPEITIGEDLQAWGIFLGMAIFITAIFTTAIPTKLQMILCPGILFATAIWAMGAYKAYKIK